MGFCDHKISSMYAELKPIHTCTHCTDTGMLKRSSKSSWTLHVRIADLAVSLKQATELDDMFSYMQLSFYFISSCFTHFLPICKLFFPPPLKVWSL